MSEIVIQQTEAGSGGQYYEFAPDVYDAVVSNIEEVDNPFEDDKTQLEFTFEVPAYTNEDGSVASKRSWANPVFNAKSKLYQWVTAILGEAPPPGEPFRTSMLIGKPCRIVLNKGVNSKNEPIVKLTDVLGPVKAAKAAPKKPGLAARLAGGEKVDGAEPITMADTDVCKECGSADIQYTSKGTPYCSDCMP